MSEKREKEPQNPKDSLQRRGHSVLCAPQRRIEGGGAPVWVLGSSSQGPLAWRRFQLPGEGSGQTGEQVGRCACVCFLTCAPVTLRPLGLRTRFGVIRRGAGGSRTAGPLAAALAHGSTCGSPGAEEYESRGRPAARPWALPRRPGAVDASDGKSGWSQGRMRDRRVQFDLRG